MMVRKYICLLSAVVILSACQSTNESKGEVKAEAQVTKSFNKDNLNVSILMDLSDRIDTEKYPNPSMEYYQRDLGYISSISKAFEQYIRKKNSRLLNDQIQVYFEPEPLNPQINKLAGALKFSFTKDNARSEEIQKISKQYSKSSAQIYNLALHDKQFDGADIWSFFKNKVNDYCIKPAHRNILFILTDGYMFHKNTKFLQGTRSSYLVPELIKAYKLNTPAYGKIMQDKGYGFIPANTDLNELEVFVLGINPNKGNPFEGDVIKMYWEKWLREMKVKKYVIKQADLPSNLEVLIQRYINP